MEGWIGWVRSSGVMRDGMSSSIPRSLLVALLLYSFTSQFLPIEPYLVPYLITSKHFTNVQVTVDIYPYSVYSQLIFTLLMATACFYLSMKTLIILGAFSMMLTYLIAWIGKSLFIMQIMQVAYGFGMATRSVFSSYLFLLISEEHYQTMTSYTTTMSLFSFMLASELSQFLALQEASYGIYFIFTISSLGLCFMITFFLPKDQFLGSVSSLKTAWHQNKQWSTILKETWNSRTLQILSLWWAVSYAGFSLVQNYGTNLFDAIDSESKYNGHILAASQAAGSIGSLCAIYLEDFARKTGLLFYVFGSALMSILCFCMGTYVKIWGAYILYVMLSGIYQALACLVSVRCSRLLSNGQYILLFSVNNFVGLLLETLLQAAMELLGLQVFEQFISFASFFLLATVFFAGLSFFEDGKADSFVLTSNSDNEDLIERC